MTPLSLQQLSNVTGGKGGAILGGIAKAGGAALQAAPGILQGVAGIVGAAKGGGGGGDPGGGGAPAGPPPGAMAAAPGPAGGGGGPGPTGSVSADGLTRITNNVSIS